MSFATTRYEFKDKAADYQRLAQELEALLAGETDATANAANTAALLFDALPDINWAGFYFLKAGELVVGPFQGKPACVRIAVGRGVCGTAVERRQSVLVEDVHAFPGHIPCDAASRSEIVVPLVAGGWAYSISTARASRASMRPILRGLSAWRVCSSPPVRRPRAACNSDDAGTPVHAGPHGRRCRVHDLGPVPALPAPAARGPGAADHRPSHRLVVPVHPRLDAAARTARAPQQHLHQSRPARPPALERSADQRQLAGLCVGGEPWAHRGDEPGVLHQSADERRARHLRVAH
jgi:GAF domain-containing protein